MANFGQGSYRSINSLPYLPQFAPFTTTPSIPHPFSLPFGAIPGTGINLPTTCSSLLMSQDKYALQSRLQQPIAVETKFGPSHLGSVATPFSRHPGLYGLNGVRTQLAHDGFIPPPFTTLPTNSETQKSSPNNYNPEDNKSRIPNVDELPKFNNDSGHSITTAAKLPEDSLDIPASGNDRLASSPLCRSPLGDPYPTDDMRINTSPFKEGSASEGEDGELSDDLAASSTPKKYPDYCKTITIKDSNGQLKELVFPKALDLDRPKRARTTFSPEQLYTLEAEFRRNQYLVGRERTDLSQRLGLSETQVKVWFQNRRTKHKRDKYRDSDVKTPETDIFKIISRPSLPTTISHPGIPPDGSMFGVPQLTASIFQRPFAS